MTIGTDEGTGTATVGGGKRTLRWPWKKSKLKMQKQVAPDASVENGHTATGQDTVSLSHVPVMKTSEATEKETTKGVRVSKSKSLSLEQQPRRVSWFCRTHHFHKLCDSAFDVIDTDDSGSVDEKELYSGLLLIHLKLGMYAGPAACRPLAREKCHAVFAKFDVDESGTLDKEEFRQVMMVLFGNVILRVIVQWTMTIMIVPLLARRILEWVYQASERVFDFIANLDQHSSIADSIEVSFETICGAIWTSLPTLMHVYAEKMGHLLRMVPDSVWNALPLTIISSVLGIVVVPWIIFKVDDFFQWLADRKTSGRN